MTGEGNDIEDIVMPISSFSVSLQADADDTVSCVVPDGQRFATVLSERSSGQLQIEQYAKHIDGTLSSYQLVAWAEYDQLRLDYGIASQSISLRGRKNVPYRSPRTFVPEGVSFRSNADGIRSLTARLTVDVKPGDTVDYNNEQWIIGQVNMSANPSQGDSMEISEQNEPAGEP